MRLPRFGLVLPFALLSVACALGTAPTGTTSTGGTGAKRTITKPAATATPKTGTTAKPTGTPSPTPTPTPAGTCAGVAPVKNEDGSKPRVAVADGYAELTGFNLATLSSTSVTLRLSTYPGSGEVHVRGASIVYAWGEKKTGALRVPLPPVDLANASAEAWGATSELTVPLPVGGIKAALAADKPEKVTATIQFYDEKNAKLRDEKLNDLTIEIPLATDGTKTPAKAATHAASCVATAVSEAQPLTGSPAAVTLKTFAPARVSFATAAGTLSAELVKLTLQAPAGSAGVAIKACKVGWAWGDDQATVAVEQPLAPLTIPAGTATAAGAATDLSLPLEASSLKAALEGMSPRPGVVLAVITLIDAEGHPVVNTGLEQLKVEVPILIE